MCSTSLNKDKHTHVAQLHAANRYTLLGHSRFQLFHYCKEQHVAQKHVFTMLLFPTGITQGIQRRQDTFRRSRRGRLI